MEGRVWAVAYGAEGVPILEPKIVRQIEELSAQGWGSRRIANELGVARNTVRRYLRGGEAAQQHVRPRARRLDAAVRRKAIACEPPAEFGQIE
jgi:IS30 family transposase